MGNQHSTAHALPRPRKNVHWKSAGRPAVPGKPEIIPMLSEEEPNAITLRWAPAAHDGGSPLYGYQVECNRLGSAEWVRTAPALVARPELLLTGLAAPHRYQFRVATVAAAGRSDYSALSDVLSVRAGSPAAVPPAFSRRLQDLTALENDTTEFRVAFSGDPPPAIAWFKDDYEIFSSRRTAISTDDGSSVLVFHQTLASDEGEIRCTATNRAGHAATRARLTLLAAPRLRCPRHYEDGLLFEVNETICLKTSVVGRPPPAVEWRHDGRPVLPDARTHLATTPRYAVLKIQAARREDRGEYQVLARNHLGEDAASFLVTVTAPPQPPRRVRLLRQRGRSVALAWDPPPDDGGCRVGNYVVEYWRAGWNVWLKATTSRSASATLSDLIEGSEYRFRVKAESPYGMSLPSEESAPVTVPGRPPDAAALAAEAAILAASEAAEPPAAPRRARSGAAPPPPADEVSEVMLLLHPDTRADAATQQTERGKSFQLELSEALCPPALSLSAPELSPRMQGPPNAGLRRAVSCSRLLLERAMARAYTALALQESQRRRARSPSVPPSPPPTPPSPPPTPPSPPHTLPSPAWPSASFDEDYTASTATTSADERSDSGSTGRASHASYEDETTYHPPTAPSTPLTLPDPTFVPKPILKKRELDPPSLDKPPVQNNRSQPNTPILDRIGSKKEEKKKGTLFKKIAKLPVQKPNFVFPKIGSKKPPDHKLPHETIPETEKMTPKSDTSEAKYDDPGRTVIEYYGNIVKEYGSQKRATTPLYLNTEDLKTVAEKQELENKAIVEKKINKKKKTVATKNNEVLAPTTKSKIKETTGISSSNAAKVKQRNAGKMIIESSDSNSIFKPAENNNISNKKCSQHILLKTTERATIVIPIDYEELEKKAKVRVRSAIDYCVDVCLLLVAFWLFLFRDERLAVPPLALLAFRALRDAVRAAPAWPRPRLSPPFARYFYHKTS